MPHKMRMARRRRRGKKGHTREKEWGNVSIARAIHVHITSECFVAMYRCGGEDRCVEW